MIIACFRKEVMSLDCRCSWWRARKISNGAAHDNLSRRHVQPHCHIAHRIRRQDGVWLFVLFEEVACCQMWMFLDAGELPVLYRIIVGLIDRHTSRKLKSTTGEHKGCGKRGRMETKLCSFDH